VLSAAFLLLQFGFIIFWQKNIGKKAACKMLLTLTTGKIISTYLILVFEKAYFLQM